MEKTILLAVAIDAVQRRAAAVPSAEAAEIVAALEGMMRDARAPAPAPTQDDVVEEDHDTQDDAVEAGDSAQDADPAPGRPTETAPAPEDAPSLSADDLREACKAAISAVAKAGHGQEVLRCLSSVEASKLGEVNDAALGTLWAVLQETTAELGL